MSSITHDTVDYVLSLFWRNQQFQIEKLAGDASSREYFRSTCNNCSVIVMDTHTEFDIKTDPFITVTEYLSERALPVPEILQCFPDRGILILQDLGDETVQKHFSNDPLSTSTVLYNQILDILVKMHSRCLPDKATVDQPFFKLRFDKEKLLWELDFFLKHFVDESPSVTISSKNREFLKKNFYQICCFLDESCPWVFTHRDFHSRNLMVKENAVFMIDYQDARLGLPEYDLASLLRDAYLELPETVIENFLGEYYKEMSFEYHHRRTIFSIMCIQRNLKALGTFGYQANSLANRGYLKYVDTLASHINRELNYLLQSNNHSSQVITEIKTFRSILNEIIHR